MSLTPPHLCQGISGYLSLSALTTLLTSRDSMGGQEETRVELHMASARLQAVSSRGLQESFCDLFAENSARCHQAVCGQDAHGADR